MSEDRCQFLIARDGKNYCKLATELARTECEVEHPSICETCKKVTEISDQKLSKYLKNFHDKTGMIYKKYNLEFFGLCTTCKRS